MLYQISNGVVELSGEVVLKNINFEIRDKEKIAVVGRNGCGKTTLLRLINGEIDIVKRSSDTDMYIAKTGKPEIGYLRQIAFENPDISMEEEIRKVFSKIESMKERLSKLTEEMETDHSPENIRRFTSLQEEFENIGGYFYEKEYEILIKKFGFTQEDKKKPLGEFSGGQQTKIAFIKLLLSKPDILLLDEPTNHLDINTVQWLEKYLKNYPKAVVVVSHDRMFLDNIADVVYEIEYGVTKRYPGNYSAFMERKKADYEKQLKDYKAQQKEIDRLNNIVEKYKNTPTKVSMTRSKLKAIEHMDIIESPEKANLKTFHTDFAPAVETGKDVLYVKNLKIGYDSVLSEVSLDVKKGEKIGIIGGNGLGKSTFLKTLMGLVKALDGEFSFGSNVQIGYFDQQMAQYKSDKQVIDDFWDEFPELSQTEVRNNLGAFLFTGDNVFKNVNMLSGGEKVRLALCKIFKRKPNVLILDEPTNHMDIVGKETLENILCRYEGTVLFVSHDRYFVKKVAKKVLVFNEDGPKLYEYGYDEYLEEMEKNQNDEELALSVNKNIKQEKSPDKGKASFNPGKELSKMKKKLEKIEEKLEEEEENLEQLKDQLSDPQLQSDYIKLSEIQENIDSAEERIMDLMEQWEEISGKIEEMS